MAGQNSDDRLLIEIGLTDREYGAQLRRMEASIVRSAKKQEAAFKRSNARVVRGFDAVNKSASRASSQGLRMASMQLSQVASQGAVTGNYLQALAIQAPDLALGFGAVGIAAGALVPVLYGLASAAFSAEEEIANIDVEAAYSSAVSAIDGALEAQDRYTAAIRLSGDAQSLVTPEILGSLKLEAQAREALAAVEIARLERQRLAAEKQFQADKTRLAELEALAVNAARRPIARGETDEAQVIAAVRAEQEELVLSIREQEATLDLVNAQLQDGSGHASEMVDEMLNAANAGAATASAIGSIDFSNALSGAQALAARLDISLHKAMQIMGVLGAAAQAARDAAAGPILDPRDPNFDPVKAQLARIQSEGYNTVSPFDPSRMPRVSAGGGRGGGGGGGGQSGGGGGKSEAQLAAEKEQNRLLSARDKILRDLETPMAEYQRKLADITKLQEMGELTSEQFNAALADLDAERLKSEFGAILDGIEDISDAFADAAVDSGDLRKSLNGIFKGILSDLLSSGLEDALIKIVAPLMRGGGFLSTVFAGLSGGGIPSGGSRATGGPVRAGMVHDVGENGREKFVPAVNGRILSTAQAKDAMRPMLLGGGGGNKQVVQVNNYGSPDNVQEERRRGPSGEELIILTVDKAKARGRFDGSERSRYGKAPKPVRRG